MSRDPSEEWTIDELATRAGVPSRTIRDYRTFGVLAPPAKRGRIGVYDDEHLERLRLIGRLQARGYSLAAIRDLLDSWAEGRTLGTVLDLGDTIGVALDETPMALTASELDEAIPGLSEPKRLRLAESAGLVTKVDGQLIVRSPALVRLVAEAIAAGVPLAEALDVVDSFRAGARIQATQLAEILINHLWEPDGDNAATQSLARRARLLVAQAAASLVVDELSQALTAAAETRAGRGLDELARRIRVGAVATKPKGQTR